MRAGARLNSGPRALRPWLAAAASWAGASYSSSAWSRRASTSRILRTAWAMHSLRPATAVSLDEAPQAVFGVAGDEGEAGFEVLTHDTLQDAVRGLAAAVACSARRQCGGKKHMGFRLVRGSRLRSGSELCRQASLPLAANAIRLHCRGECI